MIITKETTLAYVEQEIELIKSVSYDDAIFFARWCA